MGKKIEKIEVINREEIEKQESMALPRNLLIVTDKLNEIIDTLNSLTEGKKKWETL